MTQAQKTMKVAAGNATATTTTAINDALPAVPCPTSPGYTYTGMRYVPVFADPPEWSSANTYEPLEIVIHNGSSYTSKTFVPVGIDIENSGFWVLTGNYNAQVELYRREVQSLSNKVVPMYDSVALMKADDSLKSGDVVGTVTRSGSRGGAYYSIVETSDLPHEVLDNGLFATVIDPIVRPEMFGEGSDGINIAMTMSRPIIMEGEYTLTESIMLTPTTLITMSNCRLTCTTANTAVVFTPGQYDDNVDFGGTVISCAKVAQHGIATDQAIGVSIKNVTVEGASGAAIVVGNQASPVSSHMIVNDVICRDGSATSSCIVVYDHDCTLTNSVLFGGGHAVDVYGTLVAMDMIHMWAGINATSPSSAVHVATNSVQLNIGTLYFDSYAYGIETESGSDSNVNMMASNLFWLGSDTEGVLADLNGMFKGCFFNVQVSNARAVTQTTKEFNFILGGSEGFAVETFRIERASISPIGKLTKPSKFAFGTSQHIVGDSFLFNTGTFVGSTTDQQYLGDLYYIGDATSNIFYGGLKVDSVYNFSQNVISWEGKFFINTNTSLVKTYAMVNSGDENVNVEIQFGEPKNETTVDGFGVIVIPVYGVCKQIIPTTKLKVTIDISPSHQGFVSYNPTNVTNQPVLMSVNSNGKVA